MLVLSRGPEEGIMIGADVEVRVLEVRGDKVRLGIVAPAEVSIHRKEVFLNIQRENRAAAASEAASLDRAVQLLGKGGPPQPGAARPESERSGTDRPEGKRGSNVG